MAPRLRRGVLITLEGGEGAGKTTVAEALAGLLRDEGYKVLRTREPAGTDLGRLIKEALERLAAPGEAASTGGGPAYGGGVTPAAELLLFEAARAQHVEEVIRPALERGEVVLCDRFSDSTLAYQGYGRGLSLDHIRACNHIATGGLAPHLTLLLDVLPEVGLARAERRPSGDLGQVEAGDAIGRESLQFHRRVREGFLTLAQREPGRFQVLDAGPPAEAVTAAAWERVKGFLEHIL